MNEIIYRKSDLICVGTIADNMTVEQEIKLNVIPNFGGIASDYNSIETDKQNIHLENVNGVVTIIDNPIQQPTPQPSQQDLLNAKLLKDSANIQLELNQQKKLNADLLLKIAKLGGIANV